MHVEKFQDNANICSIKIIRIQKPSLAKLVKYQSKDDSCQQATEQIDHNEKGFSHDEDGETILRAKVDKELQNLTPQST